MSLPNSSDSHIRGCSGYGKISFFELGERVIRENLRHGRRLQQCHTAPSPIPRLEAATLGDSLKALGTTHFAGTPLTVAQLGTSRTTQALPPTVLPRPTVSAFNTTPETPISTPSSITQSPEMEASGLTLT